MLADVRLTTHENLYIRSPNCKKLAVVTTDRIVHVFDENGEKKDKFSTKAAEADGPKVL